MQLTGNLEIATDDSPTDTPVQAPPPHQDGDLSK